MKMSVGQLAELTPQAIRTPPPPPPAQEQTVIIAPDPPCPRCSEPPPRIPEPPGAETMPDAGWLEKHLRQNDKKVRLVFIIAFCICASGFLGYFLNR